MFWEQKGNKFIQKTWPSFLLDLGGGGFWISGKMCQRQSSLSHLFDGGDTLLLLLPFPPPPSVSEPTTGKRKRSGIEPFGEGENSPKPRTYVKGRIATKKLEHPTFLPCSFRYK